MAEAKSTVRFRAIPDFPGYRVGDDSSVWSCLQRVYYGCRAAFRYEPCGEWVRLKPMAGGGGYLEVQLRRDGKGHHCSIHRLVLEAFVGPCPPGMEAAHGDGDKFNNNLDNLRWATKTENQADRVTHGTDCRGERHGAHKLTEADVVEIIRLVHSGRNPAVVGRQYGIARTTASRIARGKTWKHINPLSVGPSSGPSATIPMTTPQDLFSQTG